MNYDCVINGISTNIDIVAKKYIYVNVLNAELEMISALPIQT